MESFVLGVFQEQLSKFIVGFHKDQVNANLLNGKGEIRDVELNCAVLNDLLATITPFVELESVHVSRLGFHVTSWSNLKKAPIVIDVGHVHIVIVEPLHFLDTTSGKRRRLEQISTRELDKRVTSGQRHAFLRGPYNLFDRIMDNMALEISSIHVSFQPRGKFKTRRTGPWTPPKLVASLKHVQYVCVNEYGQQASPEEVWRHNRHHPKDQPSHQRTFTIYKKLSMECNVSIQPATTTTETTTSRNDSDKSSSSLPPLVKDGQVEVQFALLKRLRDAAILAVQVDATLNKIEVRVEKGMVPHLAHAVAGLQYCFAKDRAFEDPLLGISASTTATEEGVEASLSESNGRVELEGADSTTTNGSSSLVLVEEETPQPQQENAMQEVAAEELSSSSSDEEEEAEAPITTTQQQQQNKPQPQGPPARTGFTSTPARGDRPVIILPNGLVIHDRVSFSLSVHHLSIRGTYGSEEGYVQANVKGLIAELMWPKVTGEKGVYGQLSLSYVSIQERYGKRLRSVLVGGIQDENYLGPVEKPSIAPEETEGDVNFPLFEDRSIREDPLGLRHSFPAQAFGLKTTVDFIESTTGGKDDITVLHEVGIDRFDVVLDSEAWSRALMFVMNKDGGGFDPRWHSGDWIEELTTEMLVHPSQNFVFEDHIQPVKEIFLDENQLISSDLFNATVRITNVEVRVPAAIEKDVLSCDVIMSMSEAMLLVSSALPRTFLNGKIWKKSKKEEGGDDSLIEFPNDPSDICYSMEEEEDPSIRQTGSATSRAVSTFRLQLTMRGHSVRVSPVIPFCDAAKPQQLLVPEDFTLIACFEGEPPESPESNLTKIALFVSMLVQRMEVNCDFDILAGAISTFRYHVAVTGEVVDSLRRAGILSPVQSPASSPKREKIRSGLRGRRVVVRRQFQRSRETGGLSVAICFQVNKFGFHLWRQNVPQTSRFRPALRETTDRLSQDKPLSLVQLVEFQASDVEVGLEFSTNPRRRRIVWKCCLSEMILKACNFDAECDKHRRRIAAAQSGDSENEEGSADVVPDPVMFDLLTLKEGVLEGGLPSLKSNGTALPDILIRVEEQLDSSRSISLACEVSTGGAVDLRKVDEVECLFLLILESLLLPDGMYQHHDSHVDSKSGFAFPNGSVGALLVSIVTKIIASLRKVKRGIEDEHNDSPASEVGGIAQWIQRLVKRLLPKDTGAALLRLSIRNFVFFAPRREDSHESEGSSYCVLVDEASLATGFFTACIPENEAGIMEVFAGSGKTWVDLLGDVEKGLHIALQSCQSLHALAAKGSTKTVESSLLPPFESVFSYRPSGVSASAGNASVTVDGAEELREIYISFSHFASRWLGAGRRIFRVLASLVSGGRDVERDTDILVDQKESTGDFPPFAEACVDVATSVRAGRSLLNSIRSSLASQELERRSSLREKQGEIDRLRGLVFSKERDRLAALALTASQAAGWIRMGGTHQSGQRTSSVTTMWRHWAVLRRSLLVLFATPGGEPVDFISLKGARLRPLAGGRNRRDVKLGFVLIEKGGMTRFFVAGTSVEYHMWVRELRNALDFYAPVESEEDRKMLFENDLMKSQGKRQVEQTSVRSVDATRASHSNSYLADVPESTALGLNDENELQPSRHKGKIRQKLAGTKAKLGSAVQTAKQNVKAASEKQRLRRLQGGEDDSSVASDNVSQSESIANVHNDAPAPGASHSVGSGEGNTGNTNKATISAGGQNSTERQMESFSGAPKKGKMFRQKFAGTKARLGSAVQATRQNLKAAAEKQRRSRSASEEVSLCSADDSTMIHGDYSTSVASNEMPKSAEVREPLKPGMDEKTESAGYSDVLHGPGSMIPEANSEGDVSFSGEDDAIDLLGVSVEEQETTAMSTDEVQIEEDASCSSNSPRRGGQIRKSVSKIGAAVKRVNSGPPRSPDDNKTKFSLRRFSKSSSASGFGGEDPIRMKKVHAGTGSLDTGYDFENRWQDIPLKKIEGHWLVVVEESVRLGERVEAGAPGATVTVDVSKDLSSSVTPDGVNRTGLTGDNSEAAVAPLSDAKSTVDTEELMVQSTAGDKNASDNAVGTLAAESLSTEDVKSNFDNEKPIDTPVSQAMSESTRRDTPMLQSFRIRVVCEKLPDGIMEKAPNSVERSFADVLELHTVVSEAVSRMGPFASNDNASEDRSRELTGQMSNSLASRLGLSPLDSVRLTGKMLGSLVDAPYTTEEFDKIRTYQCEILSEFLNSTLSCALPLDANEAVAKFLGIEIAQSPWENHSEQQRPAVGEQVDATPEGKVRNPLLTTENILSLSAACDAELARAESCGLVARRLAQNAVSSSHKSTKNKPEQLQHPYLSPAMEPSLPPSIADTLHASMHEALMKVMVERDEAHAQLVSNRVLHVHEVEQERKKVDRLTKQFELIKNESPPGGASFFLGGDEIAALEKERMRSYERQLSQNSDAELISLCQQLASEISERTNAALEIIRLKELRKIERSTELAERDALKSQLQKYKEKLAEEESKTKQAQQEATEWKESYDKLLKENQESEKE